MFNNNIYLIPRVVLYQIQAFLPGWYSYEDLESVHYVMVGRR